MIYQQCIRLFWGLLGAFSSSSTTGWPLDTLAESSYFRVGALESIDHPKPTQLGPGNSQNVRGDMGNKTAPRKSPAVVNLGA